MIPSSSDEWVYAIGATVTSRCEEDVEDQKFIEGIAHRSQKKARALIRKANEQSRTLLLRKGITIVKEMVDDLTKIAAEVQAELTGKLFSKEELAMVIKHRDELRAKHAKR